MRIPMSRRYSVVTFALALCAVVLLCGCSPSAKKKRHLARGEEHFKAEQYEKAEIEFLNLLRVEPTNAIAHRHLGLTYFQQGKWLRSYAFLQKAHELTPGNAEVGLHLAEILLALRDSSGARAHAEAILARDPSHEEALLIFGETAGSTNDTTEVSRRLEMSRPGAGNKPGFHLALGMTHLRQGRTNDAAAAFQHAFALDPKSSSAHLALANLALLSLDHAKAELHFKTAAELAPLRSSRRLRYADFKLRSGDLPAARTFLLEITKQAPDYVPAYVRLAELALTERQFDEAAVLGKKVLTLDPGNYDAMLLLAQVRVGKGDLRGALTEFERLATAYPRIPQAHYEVGVAHFLNNNPAKASASLQQVLALHPRHTDSILMLAGLNVRQGNAAAAILALKQLIQQEPQIAQAHLLLGVAYRALDQPDAAAQAYGVMAKLFPRDPQPHFAWGQLLLAEGKKDVARQKFERAVELAPDLLPAIEALANLDIAEGNFSAAEKRVADAIVRNPKAPGLLLIAAKIHSSQKHHTAAEGVLSRAIALDPNYDAAYLALARVYIDANQHQKAVETLNTVVSRSTNNVAALLQLGMVHHQLANYKAARDAYEKLLVVDSRFFPALNNLASLYSEQFNELERAYTLATSARELRRDDPIAGDTLGWILYKRGDYRRALPLLQESADKLPKSSEIQFHLGMTQYMLGNEVASRAAFERALAGAQDFRGKDEAQARLAILSNASTEPLSLATLEQQVADNPKDPILLSRVAAAYEKSGAFSKAAAACERMIQQNPRNVSAMVKLARYYAGPLREPAKALQVARNARAVAPEDRHVAEILGALAFQSGDYKSSLTLLEEAARSGGDQPGFFYYLAWARYSAGRIADADRAMKQVLASQTPFPETTDARRFLEMNAIASLAKTDVAAGPQVDAVLQEDGNYVPALFASAVLQQRAGNAAIARHRYEAILGRFPDFVPAHKGLAVLLSKSAATAGKAFEHGVKAREALPTDREVARALGIVAFHRKDYARSAQLLKEYTGQTPNDAEAFYYLGMAHFHLKQNDACRSALERAISFDAGAPFVAEARRLLADLK